MRTSMLNKESTTSEDTSQPVPSVALALGIIYINRTGITIGPYGFSVRRSNTEDSGN